MRLARGLCAAMVGCCCTLAGAQQAVQITDGAKHDVDPRVSPDGNHLVFSSNRTGNYDLFRMTFGQPGVLQLTQTKEDDRYPVWSPEGDKIIFNSRRTGNGDIYEMSASGGAGFLQLTDGADMEEQAGAHGQALVFAKGPKKLVQIRPKFNVVVAEARAGANSPQVLGEGDEPRFSPDGTSILFVSRRTKNNDVWLMGRDGSRPTQLTTDPKDDENPSFSPDGKQIVFASKRTGNFDIWVMNADGSNVRQLTTDAADERQPCWSQGGYVYFTRALSGDQTNIFRIPAP